MGFFDTKHLCIRLDNLWGRATMLLICTSNFQWSSTVTPRSLTLFTSTKTFWPNQLCVLQLISDYNGARRGEHEFEHLQITWRALNSRCSYVECVISRCRMTSAKSELESRWQTTVPINWTARSDALTSLITQEALASSMSRWQCHWRHIVHVDRRQVFCRKKRCVALRFILSISTASSSAATLANSAAAAVG